MKPLEASIFRTLPDDLKDQLIRSNVVPVNDSLMPLWGNTHGILLLYGSFGSGKSVFLVDELLNKCIENKYFRCYFGRKVLDSVRGTIFQTIVDRIKELHKEHLFSFSEAPNGSMEIRHKESGNKFLPFGGNDADSLKSIKDPTHFLLDEFDQFDFDDFKIYYSRLRTEKAVTQLYAAMNTDKVYKSHWVRKVLFDGEMADEVTKVKVNYTDNHFLDQAAYEKKLRLIAAGNVGYFNAIARGEWGMVKTGNEFWKQFDDSKHVKSLEILPTTIHLTLDENVNPYVTISAWQVLPETKELRQIHEIPCRSPDNNAPKAARRAAEWLRSIDYHDTVFIYGDPSGGKRSTIDANNKSFFDKFIEVLRSEGFVVISRVQRSAPEVALSAAFINAIYESNLGGWTILIHDRCFTSIEDYYKVLEDADGKMQKDRVKDKETGITYEANGHFSDAKRYFITTILAQEFARYKARGRRRGATDIAE